MGGSVADAAWLAAPRRPAVTIVRVFYGLCLLWVIEGVGSWNRLLDSDVINPAWPASWIDSADPRTGVGIVLGAVLVAAIWVAMLPQQRAWLDRGPPSRSCSTSPW